MARARNDMAAWGWVWPSRAVFVEMHGGTISAESGGVGCGSTFTLRIPIRSARESLPARAITSEESRSHTLASDTDLRNLSGVRILSVDDEKDSRELVKEVLEQFGAKVFSAGSAMEAFTAFHDWNPDLIVCDIGMPGEDGYSLIRRVRQSKSDRARATPAIALTGLLAPKIASAHSGPVFRSSYRSPLRRIN